MSSFANAFGPVHAKRNDDPENGHNDLQNSIGKYDSWMKSSFAKTKKQVTEWIEGKENRKSRETTATRKNQTRSPARKVKHL
jgi:hypothetical protein